MDGVMHPSVEQAIGRDRIRKAFKRYENNPADEHDRGIVRAVNADGSYEVLLDGDVQTARCAPYAKAMVGDRVIVVTTKDGENVLLGRLGGEIGGGGSSEDNSWYVNPADYVVEWGNTDGWRWEKWASGKAECWATLTRQDSIQSSFGQFNLSYLSLLMTYPFEFVEEPIVTASANSQDYTLFTTLSGGSTTQTPYVNAARPANAAIATEIDIEYSIRAVGFWKDSPASGGTETIAPTIEERFEKLEVDYIVAEGTSGSWKWRKWDSGIAECWGVFGPFDTSTYPIYQAVGFYYLDTSVPYPFSFAGIDSIQTDTEGYAFVNCKVVSGTTVSVTLRLSQYGTDDNMADTKALVVVKGRWK